MQMGGSKIETKCALCDNEGKYKVLKELHLTELERKRRELSRSSFLPFPSIPEGDRICLNCLWIIVKRGGTFANS